MTLIGVQLEFRMDSATFVTLKVSPFVDIFYIARLSFENTT